MAKGKPQQHTAKEIASKTKMATQNAGGGKGGLADRLGGKAGHAKFVCYICKQQAPDLKSMGMHFDSKHPKETLDPSKFVDTHELYGGTTQGVAVKGTLKKANMKAKEKEKKDEPKPAPVAAPPLHVAVAAKLATATTAGTEAAAAAPPAQDKDKKEEAVAIEDEDVVEFEGEDQEAGEGEDTPTE